MNLQCQCKNISIQWNNAPVTIRSRMCGCNYCLKHKGEYISDPESEFSYKILDKTNYNIVKHGHGTAEFHECAKCGLTFVTCEIDGERYGIINSVVMGIDNCQVDRNLNDYSSESIEDRLQRRKQRWSKVSINS